MHEHDMTSQSAINKLECERKQNNTPSVDIAYAMAVDALEKQEKLEKYSKMLESTFDWGCNDHAKYLYSLAVYSVISGKEIFKECEEEFIEYIAESTHAFSR